MRAIILERYVERGQRPFLETHLFLKLSAYSDELGGGLVPMSLGWTMLNLFDEDKRLMYLFN
jgi:hypothetical protein